jgi:hypothetical protein
MANIITPWDAKYGHPCEASKLADAADAEDAELCMSIAVFRMTPDGKKDKARYSCARHLARMIHLLIDQGAACVVVRRKAGFVPDGRPSARHGRITTINRARKNGKAAENRENQEAVTPSAPAP